LQLIRETRQNGYKTAGFCSFTEFLSQRQDLYATAIYVIDRTEAFSEIWLETVSWKYVALNLPFITQEFDYSMIWLCERFQHDAAHVLVFEVL